MKLKCEPFVAQALMEHKLAEEHARRKQEDADFKNRESAIIAAAEETAAEKLAADAEKQVRIWNFLVLLIHLRVDRICGFFKQCVRSALRCYSVGFSAT